MYYYPHFISCADTEEDAALVINYMSDQDVPLDFPVFVVAYDMAEAEARERISVRDIHEFEGDTVFVLEPQETDHRRGRDRDAHR